MSRSRFPIDVALTLQAIGSAAITATAASTNSIELARTEHRALPDRIGVREIAVVVDVLAFDKTTNDETYAVDVEVSATADFAQAVVVHTFPISTTGARHAVVENDAIELACPGAAYMR